MKAPQLVLLHGREKAKQMVPPEQRRLIDIAAEVLGDENQGVGFSYTGFCLTGLPHKRLPDEQPWEKRGHRVMMLVEPGRMQQTPRSPARLYGVPYGARARMILLYLQTQAIRTNSREVELGRSMRDWLNRMGLALGGETAKALREQAARISACSLKFFWESDDKNGFRRGGIVSTGLRFSTSDDTGQPSIWEDRVELDELFWDMLRKHPVPLREAAIRELRDRSMSLDIYIWLAYRLHSLSRPTPIGWAALSEQFGVGYKQMFHFRAAFREALAPALSAYPEAKVEVEDTGLVLHPSPPAVAALVRPGARPAAIG